MDETTKAYLAGLVDADGSIYITNSPALFVKIESANKSFLWRWHNKTGYGNVYLSVPKCSEHPQGSHQWVIRGKEAACFLKEIFPYLDLKKKQAELAFQFAETIGAVGRRSLDAQTRHLREVLRLSIKALNNYQDKGPEEISNKMRQKDLDRLREWQGRNSHPYLIRENEDE